MAHFEIGSLEHDFLEKMYVTIQVFVSKTKFSFIYKLFLIL
jgi:hypothetical protein